SKPRDRFGVGAEINLGGARDQHPDKSIVVARGKAQRLVDFGFGFLGMTGRYLADAHLSVGVRETRIDRQGPLELGEAQVRSFGLNEHSAHEQMRPCIVRRQRALCSTWLQPPLYSALDCR